MGKLQKLRDQLGRIPLTPEDVELLVADEKEEAVSRALRRLQNKYTVTESKAQQMIDEVEHLRYILDTTLDVTESSPSPTVVEPISTEMAKNEIVPVSLLSDVHAFERVLPERVMYTNEYNPEEAVLRMRRWAQKTVKVINSWRKEHHITTWYLNMLGDLVGNQIRPESKENNAGTVNEEVLFMIDVLMGVIIYIQENCKFDRIIITGVCGNHDRLTPKVEAVNEARQSSTWLLYGVLRKMLRQRPDIYKHITFDIGEGRIELVNLLRKVMVRSHHGHGFRYQKGVGGPLISGYKYVNQLNKAQQADIDFCGHHHTSLLGGPLNINGSVIGTSTWALGEGYGFELPTQLLLGIHGDLGMIKHEKLVLARKWSDIHPVGNLLQRGELSEIQRENNIMFGMGKDTENIDE